MLYIRSGLYLLGQVISAMIISFAATCLFFLPHLKLAKLIKSWSTFNLWSLKVLCRLTYKVTGLENIPKSTAIVVSNHQSAWETLMLQKIFPVTSFVLKKQLLKIPFFGWGLALYKPVAIDRSKKNKALDQLIKQGAQRLESGRWLVIFPEGTRQSPGNPGAFQAGAAMIAAKTGKPIVPVAHNAGYFWSKRGFLKRPGIIDIVIGSPIYPQGMKTREINAQVQRWMQKTIVSLTKEKIS